MLNKIKNKKIAILGLGIENYALIKFVLSQKVDCEITVCDSRERVELEERLKEFKTVKNIKWQLGDGYNKELEKQDILFRSPGWPLFDNSLVLAEKAGVVISSPMKLFFEICPTKNIIGVTGTKGKGTTSSLIYKILKQGGKKVFLGGNIGVAPFEFFSKIKKDDWVILELSSFQLEDLDRSPKIAVITNFTREHLAPADPNNPNYHKSFNKYWLAKSNIFKWQKKSNKLVVNQSLVKKIRGLYFESKVIYFTKSELKSKLAGEYNKENIAAASEVAKLVGVKKGDVETAVKNFKGLEHRIELVKKENNIKYYDNSFATTPEATIADLDSFSEPIILLAGGADKGANFKQLARKIKKKVKFLILFDGKATPRIKKELVAIDYPKKQMKLVKSMETAVDLAKKRADSGDIVLLSTACASFGLFKNYKERGEVFKKEVGLF